jgi:hypothetical protein
MPYTSHLGMVYTTYLYLFLVILGMVYYCCTHISIVLILGKTYQPIVEA